MRTMDASSPSRARARASASSRSICMLCVCLCLILFSTSTTPARASITTPTATITPSPQSDAHQHEAVDHPIIPRSTGALQKRNPNPEPRPLPLPTPNPEPAPAQFWAGWPKETLTVVRTVTSTAPGGVVIGGGDDTTTATEETTTTLYDSNISASGTLTVTSFVIIGPGGVLTTVSDTNTATATITTTTSTANPSLSGTLTRTRTATIETQLPQETQFTPADIPRFATCLPGDEDYKEPGVLSLTKEQENTLIALAVMFLVILIGWNFVVIRQLLYPLKMLVVLVHESGHVIGGIAAGRRLETLHLDPTYGGLCVWETEIITPFPVRWPKSALPLGYLMSAFVGATFILCGFNTLASKVATFFIGIMLIVVAVNVMKSPLGLVLVILTVGLMIGFWFIDHAIYLRYYVLFVGVMCCWYIIWDFIDDFIFQKLYSCCAVLHSDVIGVMAPFMWLYIYLAITSLIFVGFLLIAIYVFRQSPHSMYCQGQEFLPT